MITEFNDEPLCAGDMVTVIYSLELSLIDGVLSTSVHVEHTSLAAKSRPICGG